jgi:hypothetical protein
MHLTLKSNENKFALNKLKNIKIGNCIIRRKHIIALEYVIMCALITFSRFRMLEIYIDERANDGGIH